MTVIQPKVSVCMAYWNRLDQLRVTLESYAHWYDWHDIEVLVVLEGGVDPAPVTELVHRYHQAQVISHPDVFIDERAQRRYRNPGVLYNHGVALAQAPLLCLTNPENAHMEPVFKHAIAVHQPGDYLVYACRERTRPVASFAELKADPMGDCGQWYQHTRYNNPMLHFCSVIATADYRMLGGFDPRYDQGLAFEDNDFVEKVLASQIGMRIRLFDDPWVCHQYHSRSHHFDERGQSPPEWYRNRDLFRSKWGYGPRLFQPDGTGGHPWL